MIGYGLIDDAGADICLESWNDTVSLQNTEVIVLGQRVFHRMAKVLGDIPR